MNMNKEQVAEAIEEYEEVIDQPYESRAIVMEDLAARFNTTIATVRGNLIAGGIYKAKEKPLSSNKTALLAAFAAVMGTSLSTLTKMSEKDLQTLWDWIVLSSARGDVK